MIILLSGLKQSGKDTIANYLVQKYNFTKYAFASPIKEVSRILFGWNEKDDEILKEVVDEQWGFSRRQFWQYFGTEWAQGELRNQFPSFDKNIGRCLWVKKFEQLFLQDTTKNYVISDFRFIHEYEILKKYNPIAIKILRDSVVANDGHASETSFKILPCDYIIKNNNSVQDTYFQIDDIIKKIS